MAPRRKSLTLRKPLTSANSDKENVYLHNLSDYHAKVRRRESLRSAKYLKVSVRLTVNVSTVRCIRITLNIEW